ncbi:hypothetical protein HYY70_06715 [Candidatus Woesearchaeota archaeon]|nr:hypothetical protein [Candidatus Woesearchaeota archaeon]
MDTRERIIEIIKAKGPVLPVQIAKEIGSNILMASAHLAELTASGMLKISAIKVGGSPLYYLAAQEAMLQKFVENMNDKEKKAYDSLSQDKILRDSEQEPVIRVALREIKDFAIPLNVNYNNNKEIFWKWYLTSNEEAERLIKIKLDIVDTPMEKRDEEPISREAPKDQKAEKPIESVQKQMKEETPKKRQKGKLVQRDKDNNFLQNVTNFFEKNNISIINSETIKGNSDIEFIIEIPSVVGNLQYYCKAKNKKKISDSDISNAYVKGNFKKLPVLIISTGDLSAKAKEMLSKELNSVTFKKI